jgi:hypothetical protein
VAVYVDPALKSPLWHGACETEVIHFPGQGDLIGVDTIESFARLAGAISLLASFKIGRGGGWTRARQRLARGTLFRMLQARAPAHRGSASPEAPCREGSRRYRDRLRALIVALWIALLLSIVGYAAVEGEAGMARLDDIGFRAVTD